MKYQLPRDAMFFRAPDGRRVVITDPLGMGIFYASSPDGAFHQLVSIDACAKPDLSEFSACCVGAPAASGGLFIRYDHEEGELSVGDELFPPDALLADEIEYEPIPTERVVSCIYQLPDGRWFCLIESVFEPQSLDLRLGEPSAYLGSPGSMQPVKVLGVYTRLPRIETELGTLHIALPGTHSSWKPKEGEPVPADRMNVASYEVTVTERRAKLKLVQVPV
jgi:hypothetical protein